MPRYFMSGTRPGRLEHMMVDPSRPAPNHIDFRRKRPQKKLPCDYPVKPPPPEREIKEEGV